MLVEIFLVHLAAMASPGPNVLLVVRTALADSRRAGLQAAAGVAAGGAIWATAAAVGLGLLLAQASIAYDVLRVLGGMYLVYLGVRTVMSATRPLAPLRALPERSSAIHNWRRGVLTNLSNPKAAVFFVSIFATLLPPDASPGLRAIAVVVIVVDALLWHGLLAVVFSTDRARAPYARAKLWIDRCAGAVMVGFGLRLATDLR